MLGKPSWRGTVATPGAKAAIPKPPLCLLPFLKTKHKNTSLAPNTRVLPMLEMHANKIPPYSPILIMMHLLQYQ